MPIILDDIASSSKASSFTPKFFSKELTGSGKATNGLINKNLTPEVRTTNAGALPELNALGRKSKNSGSSVSREIIPMGLLQSRSVLLNADKALMFDVPDDDSAFGVNTQRTGRDHDVLFDLTPQAIVLDVDGSGDSIVRTVNIMYRMEVFVRGVDSDAKQLPLVAQAPYTGTGHEYAMVGYSYSPADDAEALIHAASPNTVVVPDDFAVWLQDYSIHDAIVELAEDWTDDTVGEVMTAHIAELFAAGTPDRDVLNQLSLQMRYLENYAVSLESYRAIHKALADNCDTDVMNAFAKQNINLLMSHTLEELDQARADLVEIPDEEASDQLKARLSVQQLDAVTTSEKLALTQAGAGTGKSTTISNRIQHLVECGVPAKDITVLSFTNAAADNIKERNPDVGSMTIASMIHEIYMLNKPGQELSSIETIMNSLDIYYPASDVASVFRKRLKDMDKNAPGATTAMNTFIERNRDEVDQMLSTLRQTCLELEIIICYQQIEDMVEPEDIKARHLIIDEVQDTSIFEFIYALKSVVKNKQSLFVVGDASQTLYEFRSANPKALNALEESGVFATYQLTTNYRSNQEVLDFANVHLADIEANRAAKLRLQANSLLAPTQKSFEQKVQLHFEEAPKISEYENDVYPALVQNIAGPYVEECLARGEKVTFLAFSRRMVEKTRETLQKMYPDKHIASLVSERQRETNVFTQYIKEYWNDVLQVDPENASYVVVSGIRSNMAKLVYNGADSRVSDAVMHNVSFWWTSNAGDIESWINEHKAGAIDEATFFDRLRTCLLDFEIAENRKKFNLTKDKNRRRKEDNATKNAQISVSTIHGVKGLEFDNVVLLHRNYRPVEMKESMKRLYYVALTRAMNTELILSYGQMKNPSIVSDRNALIAQLEKRDLVTACESVGIDPENATEKQIELAMQHFELTREEKLAEAEAAED